MDNAVKALIIAGAVLIAILLIGVGITIFNSASKPLDQGARQADRQEVEMFNNSILSSVGQGISGNQVKTLVSAITSSNGQNEEHQIKINGDDAKKFKIGTVSLRKKYNAVEQIDDIGFIMNVKIWEQGTSEPADI